jgi:hypothetical protein
MSLEARARPAISLNLIREHSRRVFCESAGLLAAVRWAERKDRPISRACWAHRDDLLSSERESRLNQLMKRLAALKGFREEVIEFAECPHSICGTTSAET